MTAARQAWIDAKAVPGIGGPGDHRLG
jgi:hypothetical protein